MSDSLYSGAASFGSFITNITAVVVTVFMSLLIIFSLYELFRKDSHPEKVEGTIIAVDCQETAKNSYKCMVNANYVVNGTVYPVFDIVPSMNVLKAGDKITVAYVKDKPENAVIERYSQKQIGIVSLIVAIIVLAVVWFQVWLVKNYKFYAAGRGVVGVLDIFGLFRNK